MKLNVMPLKVKTDIREMRDRATEMVTMTSSQTAGHHQVQIKLMTNKHMLRFNIRTCYEKDNQTNNCNLITQQSHCSDDRTTISRKTTHAANQSKINRQESNETFRTKPSHQLKETRKHTSKQETPWHSLHLLWSNTWIAKYSENTK